MSVNSGAQSILPNLPGYRTKEFKTGQKKQFFTLVGGQVFLTDKHAELTNSGQIDDMASLSSIGSPGSKKKLNHSNNSTLTFQAFFEEYLDGRPDKTIRKVNIYYYMEDGTVKVVEKPQLNSGVTQGTLVRRALINKPDGTKLTEHDFFIGETLTIYGRDYKIVDCDAATRKFLYLDDTAYETPKDSWQTERDILQPGRDDTWGKYHSKKNANKTFIEAILGNNANNSGREGFMRFANKTLKFKCIWDNTGNLYGDIMEYAINYYLADDTLEINSVPTGNAAGKESQRSKLLKRSRLPRNYHDTMDLQKVPDDSSFFHWSDFYIGQELNVFGRYLKIMDADAQTRDFYEMNEMPLGEALYLPTPEVVVHQREIPPPTGFGSEEDSMRSCNGPLMPGPIPAKKLGESKILSFFGSLLSGGLDDVDRRFVLSFYLQDGTLKIMEPPVRNSGFTGGVFLSRRTIKTENGEQLKETDLYVGCKLKVLKHEFLLLDANEGTLRWMEDKCLPRSNYYLILDKIRPRVYDDARSGALSDKFSALPIESGEGGGLGMTTKEGLKSVLREYDLISDHWDDISEHELLTIVRGAGNKSKFFDYTKFVEQIVKPTDEFR